ncbi:hypothetical protein [Deinococcus hohokamensis]|uniref:Uncharacterized protein n=1 Tax=Deinococcus hohokamensis TaxID=309883 RepID=A0ABV9I728_9DEIO
MNNARGARRQRDVSVPKGPDWVPGSPTDYPILDRWERQVRLSEVRQQQAPHQDLASTETVPDIRAKIEQIRKEASVLVRALERMQGQRPTLPVPFPPEIEKIFRSLVNRMVKFTQYDHEKLQELVSRTSWDYVRMILADHCRAIEQNFTPQNVDIYAYQAKSLLNQNDLYRALGKLATLTSDLNNLEKRLNKEQE